MMPRTIPGLLLALPLLLSACDDSYVDFDGAYNLPLLQLGGEGIDGRLYMLAPRAEAVIAVDPAARSFEAIEVGREPTLMSRPPGSDLLCTLERRDGTMSRISGGVATIPLDLGAPYTTLTWSPDGSRAIAWFDPDDAAEIEVEGSLNLNAYAMVTGMETNPTISQGSLTFEPRSVTFTPDSARALIGTSARLHVVDLAADPPTELAVPFSPDDAIHRAPVLVVPGPLSDRVLVTVEGVPDLFVLNLSPVMIENVAPLDRAAMDIRWSADGTRAIVADGTRFVTFLDLETNDTEQIELVHTVDRILMSALPENSFALLYDDRGTNSYITRVELTESATAPEDPETFLLEDVVGRVELSPGETAAVIVHETVTGEEWVPVQSLSLFNFEQRAPSRILLDAAAYDMIFLAAGVVGSSENESVVVALKDSGRLVRYDLGTYGQTVLDTYPLPHAIGRVPPGQGGSELLYVVHDSDIGLVSFLPPDATAVPSGGWPAVAGMALVGLMDGR